MKVIFHLDLDSYFASAATVVDPSLKGKPIVISGGERRSIVAAASYEAKDRGVYVPMPYFKAKELVPDLISIKPDFALYTTLSSKVFEYLTKYTNGVEVASIDECYMDVTDVWQKYGSPVKLARHIQNGVMKDLSLPISIGIGENKFVAKMSTQINKPFGITVTKPGDFLEVFGDWELVKYHGIGRPSADKLKEYNINTIRDLSKADPNTLREVMGKRGPSLIDGANGKGEDVLNLEHNALKGIGNSMTIMKQDLYHRKDILDILSNMTHLVSQRAVSRNMVGRVVSVSIKEAVKGPSRPRSKQVTLIRPINKYEDIFKEVIRIFDLMWGEEPVKFVGVHLGQLNDVFETTYQMALWDEDIEKSKIDSIVDEVNRSMKTKAVITGKEARLNIKAKSKQSRYLESDRILKHFDEEMRKKK